MSSKPLSRFVLPKKQGITTETAAVETTPVKRSSFHAALRAGQFGVSSPLAPFIAHQENIHKARESLSAQRFKAPKTPVQQSSKISGSAGAQRFLPVSQRDTKRSYDAMADGEPDADEEEAFWSSQQPSQSMHNPFDVSEEVDEPVQREMADSAQRLKGHQRFMTRPRSSGSSASQRPERPTSLPRTTTSTLLANIQLDSTKAADSYTLANDWSPHKKRTTKFLPGGMAETVALWVYQAQISKQDTQADR
jgi:hypothetical protein